MQLREEKRVSYIITVFSDRLGLTRATENCLLPLNPGVQGYLRVPEALTE